MSATLNDIRKPIAEELRYFEKYFKESMESKVPLLMKITNYLVKNKGKQVRPMFIFLVSKMLDEVKPASYDAAAMIELLHTGTLVHDDVVDDSMVRRGFFSINALWKNKVAVLVGDYLLSRGFLLAIDNNRIELLRILSRSVKEMSEGELLQIEKARKLDIEESLYYDIIRQKTASLIASSCSAGAAAVTEDKATVQKLWDFGEKIGMAFQIKDDLFDYGDSNIGKPTGIDIKEKKMTLPLIFALNHADKKIKQKIIRDIKNDSENPKKVAEIIEFVKASGGIEYAQKKMVEYRTEALEMLNTFPESPARTALSQLVYFVTDRKK